MVYEGTVRGGVVVFNNGLELPDGTPVIVELVDSKLPEDGLSFEDDLLLGMSDVAIDTGVPDLAVNIDHYLYGHSKVADVE